MITRIYLNKEGINESCPMTRSSLVAAGWEYQRPRWRRPARGMMPDTEGGGGLVERRPEVKMSAGCWAAAFSSSRDPCFHSKYMSQHGRGASRTVPPLRGKDNNKGGLFICLFVFLNNNGTIDREIDWLFWSCLLGCFSNFPKTVFTK